MNAAPAAESHAARSRHATSITRPGDPVEVAPRIWAFSTRPFNWYLAEHKGRLTLIDAGFPGHLTAFGRGLASLGFSIADLDGVFLTHAHADHTGFAAAAAHAADAPVYIHRADREKATRRLQLPWPALLGNAVRPWGLKTVMHASRCGVFRATRVRDPIGVDDGDTLDLPGSPRVVATPGHTPGHASLHFEDRDTIIAGDAAVTLDMFRGVPIAPASTPRTLNMDHAAATRSTDRLLSIGAGTLLPGHGDPVYTNR